MTSDVGNPNEREKSGTAKVAEWAPQRPQNVTMTTQIRKASEPRDESSIFLIWWHPDFSLTRLTLALASLKLLRIPFFNCYDVAV